jgi:hypothetical protein
MQTSNRARIIEGLNVFRALEAWGAKLYAAWAEEEKDENLRAGHLIIAEREANHARLLGEHIRALGGQPGPACVDDVLARQLDALKAVNERDAEALAGCREALDRGFEAAKDGDPATHRFWAALYSEERVSGGWYRAKYGEVSGKRPRTSDLPVLAPDQVSRRAESATFTDGAAACASPTP